MVGYSTRKMLQQSVEKLYFRTIFMTIRFNIVKNPVQILSKDGSYIELILTYLFPLSGLMVMR